MKGKKTLALLLAALLAMSLTGCGPDGQNAFLLAKPDPLPSAPGEPLTKAEREASCGFFAETTRQFLSGTRQENRVYSPLNGYLAMHILAEITDGNSREQILSLLGPENMESLRAQARKFRNVACRDSEYGKTLLADSLWLSGSRTYRQETVDALAEYCRAASFRGEMGSPEYNRALRNWLNQQTGGLLAEQTEAIGFDSRTVLALASAVYFEAGWTNEFPAHGTADGVFHAGTGDVTCPFMHRSGKETYYWGDGFSAASLEMKGGSRMWLLLPDADSSVDALLSGEMLERFFAGDVWANRKDVTVRFSVPKFDVSSDLDLIDGLKALGITDVFSSSAADFSPISADALEVNTVKHAARVTIDEAGCLAAAYTVIIMTGGAMPPQEAVDFVLDRPFVFIITGESGLPLFTGVVNQPR